MKYTIVVLGSIAAVAVAGPLAAVASVASTAIGAIKRKKGKRDLEFEDALLVIRDRTVQQWSSAVHDASIISPEMIAALGQRGYQPPAAQAGKISARSVPPRVPGEAMTKEYALKSVQEGYPIPEKVLQHMRQAGWTGPGLGKRDFFDADEYEFEARDIDEDFLDLYVGDY